MWGDNCSPSRISKYLCIVNDGIIANIVSITGFVKGSPIFMCDDYSFGNAVMSLGNAKFSITKISIDDNPHTSNRSLCIEWSADGIDYKSYIDVDFSDEIIQ